MALFSLTWSLFTPFVNPVLLRESVTILFPFEVNEPLNEAIEDWASLPIIVLSTLIEPDSLNMLVAATVAVLLEIVLLASNKLPLL